MKKGAIILVLVLLLPVVILRFSGLYTVAEWEQVVIIEFGKPVGEPITEPGLHWRTPFIQIVYPFEKRVLEFDGQATEIPTRDKKFIWVDTFARWRIVDPLVFYQKVVDTDRAKRRLNEIIDSETRDVISNYDLIEMVRNSNRELLQDEEVIEATQGGLDEADEESVPLRRPGGEFADAEAHPRIEIGREAISVLIRDSAAEKLKLFGIDLLDVQIKEVKYVQRVQERVFERMKSERQQIAAKYRAEGQKFSSQMEGRIERERNRILSEAYREAETLKGEADAAAARIYAEAYGQDPEFYAFYKSLDLYRQSLSTNATLVISTDADLFRYLRGAGLTSLGPTSSK